MDLPLLLPLLLRPLFSSRYVPTLHLRGNRCHPHSVSSCFLTKFSFVTKSTVLHVHYGDTQTSHESQSQTEINNFVAVCVFIKIYLSVLESKSLSPIVIDCIAFLLTLIPESSLHILAGWHTKRIMHILSFC